MKSHVDCQHVSRWGGERTRAHQARCQGTNRVLLLNVYDCTSSLCVQLLSCGSLVNYGNVAWFVHSPTLLHVAQLKAFSCGDACKKTFTNRAWSICQPRRLDDHTASVAGGSVPAIKTMNGYQALPELRTGQVWRMKIAITAPATRTLHTLPGR